MTAIEKADQGLPGTRGRIALSAKDHQGTFWYSRNILHHDCGGSHITAQVTAHICQNSWNDTLKVG